ncbi:NADH-quinone oxidoreductase subunit C [Kitasatospora sp. NPDC092948]|uniref:NADH-quinone oxidoreductase subunit C n=1 Tax=Kitasatospora sp. NPDC092948 TaxID=3364088 RepID=UPI003823C53E
MTETPDVPPTPAELTAAAIGPWATAAEAYDLLTVTVPAEHWIEALTAARDVLGLAFLDWLSAVDELAEGFAVCAHLAAVGEPGRVRRLLLRTRVPRDQAVLPTAVGVYAGAAWHERETREMFGIEFPGHPHPATLLLPDGFEGHPLRKDFVLAARVAKDWPGAKEPGESDHGGGPARRKMLPPGVPDPNEWGPLKGTLPPVAERPARTTRAGAGAGVDRPRRARSVGEGSASQAAESAAPAADAPPVRADRPRRSRSVDEGSASQAAESAVPAADAPPVRADRPRRSRSVGEGSVSQTTPEPSSPPETPRRTARTQSSDAPWHAPVPAHDQPADAEPEAGQAEPAEVKPAEPARPEPVKPEAAAAEPAAAEPAEAEAVMAEPTKAEAAQPEAGQVEPAEAKPAEPARPEPVKPEAATAEPAEAESAQPEPEPEPEPGRREPAEAEAAQREPGRREPAEPESDQQPDQQPDQNGDSA